jgi:hypothetical protein
MVGAHWPTKLLCSFLPIICSAKEPAIEPKAAHRKRSEGNLAVWLSIALATPPSRWEASAAVFAPSLGGNFRHGVHRITPPCNEGGGWHASQPSLIPE